MCVFSPYVCAMNVWIIEEKLLFIIIMPLFLVWVVSKVVLNFLSPLKIADKCYCEGLCRARQQIKITEWALLLLTILFF